MFYFYVLQSQKDKNYFYKGSTTDLKRRVEKHNNGYVQSTKPYLPFKLVYYETYTTEVVARKREKSVKQSGSIQTPLLRRIKKYL